MTGRRARPPGRDPDADLPGRCRPCRPASRPRAGHHGWRPRSARPGCGRTARACAPASGSPGPSPLLADGVAGGPRVELDDGVRARIAGGPAVVERALDAGEAVYRL